MPLPDFDFSPYGYWIDLERNIFPLTDPQSHARHAAVAAFPGDDDERMQAALDAGYAAVSIFGNSFSIRTRKGAVPTPVVGDLNRVVKLHAPEMVTTEHHGSGETKAVLRQMRNAATYTVPSEPGGRSTYGTPWEEIADLRQKLKIAQYMSAQYAALESDTAAKSALKTLIGKVGNLRSQFEILQRYYKTCENIDLNRDLTDKEKLSQLGYWCFHELNRSIWYVGHLFKEMNSDLDEGD